MKNEPQNQNTDKLTHDSSKSYVGSEIDIQYLRRTGFYEFRRQQPCSTCCYYNEGWCVERKQEVESWWKGCGIWNFFTNLR